MFGIVLAIVNTSACSAVPRAAARSALRTNPLTRDTTVPAAITALEDRMLVSVPAPVPLPGSVPVPCVPLTPSAPDLAGRWGHAAAAGHGWPGAVGSGAAAGPRWRGTAGRRPRP